MIQIDFFISRFSTIGGGISIFGSGTHSQKAIMCYISLSQIKITTDYNVIMTKCFLGLENPKISVDISLKP